MKGIMSEWSLGHHHACPYELWGLASHSWGSGLGVLATLLLFGLLVQQCVNMRAYKWRVSNLCLYKFDRDVLLVLNN